MRVQHFFHAPTSTLTYVVFDPDTRDAVIIDPVLDYEIDTSRASTDSVESVAQFVAAQRLRVHYVLETHAHADHISGSQPLKERFGAPVGIGARIADVQKTFARVFDLPSAFAIDGSQFERLLREGDVLDAGALAVEVIETPGHTPACVTFKIDDAIFTGDALFIEDYGTGRCDFPLGSADALYTSVHDTLYSLPDETRVFVGHDYQPNGRALRFETTVGVSKRENVQLRAATSREAFVRFRMARDATLRPPRLMWASVQANIDAGRLPKAHANGTRYFIVPVREDAPSPTTSPTAATAPAKAEYPLVE